MLKGEKLGSQHKVNKFIIGFLMILTMSGCGGGGGGGGGGDNTTTNIAPVAEAGVGGVFNQGAEVVLNGSSSTDEDGTIVSYQWVQTAGTAVSLIDANKEFSRFTAPDTTTREELSFQLTVQDNAGGQGSDVVTITVNLKPVANAGPDQTVTLYSSETQTITLTGTSSDGDGTIVSQLWEQTGGTNVTLSGATTSTATFTVPATTEAYSFSYTVTDNDGAQRTDTVSVYVTEIIFSGSSANDSSWTFIDDTGNDDNWTVANGLLRQTNFLETGSLYQSTSYNTGTYALLNDASISSRSSYRFSVDITPEANIVGTSDGNDVGIMFRYEDDQNYYRVSMNAKYGFTRLEKRVGGNFQTLAVNAIGYVDNQPMTMAAEVNGDTIIVWIDGDPVFAVVDDSAISSARVGLYCQDQAKFDNVRITENLLQPRVVVSSPLAYSIALTPGEGDTLTAQAVVLNEPTGGNVLFRLDGGSETAAVASGNVYSLQFTGVSNGEHEVMAVLRDADGNEASSDINSTVGIGGDYYITVGDSITNGVGDKDDSNNDSADGRIVAIQGYHSRLADSLTTTTGRPQIVLNEGIEGDQASDLSSRINSILERHPGANRVLLMIGTNDSNKSVTPAAYKTSVTNIANTIVADGKQVWLAEILPTNVDVDRNTVIQQYNTQIREIANPGGDDVFLGPDFYDAFDGMPSLYNDTLHPNDAGYQVMANEWRNTLTSP